MMFFLAINFLTGMQNPLEQTQLADENPTEFSIGFGTSWFNRKDYGSSTYNRFYPEIILYSYSHIKDNFYMRWGMRVSYSQDDPEFSNGIQIREKDFMLLSHTSLLYDGVVIPSFGFIAGIQHKKIELRSSSMIETQSSKISGHEWISVIGGQVGLGIPINQGVIVLEPYLRGTVQPSVMKFSSDNRGWFWFGVDMTFQI